MNPFQSCGITGNELIAAMQCVPKLTPEESRQLRIARRQTFDGQRERIQRAFRILVIKLFRSLWILL